MGRSNAAAQRLGVDRLPESRQSEVLALLLAASIQFTLPGYKAANAACDPGTVPVVLESLFVWGEVYPSPPRILRSFYVQGWEGSPYYVGLALLGDSAAQVWLTTTAPGSPPSCPSRRVGVNGAVTDVPLPWANRERLVRYFDISGRRVERPRRPGIYFKSVEGERVRRIVVLR
jgi:hypothetical protein